MTVSVQNTSVSKITATLYANKTGPIQIEQQSNREHDQITVGEKCMIM